jgi:hypothetical protein
MSRRAFGAMVIVTLICVIPGCGEDKAPYSPDAPPDVETYPNTKVLFGVNHHRTNQSGSMVSDTIYFDDGNPDTIPCNSLLTVYYFGYDNERDAWYYDDPEMEMLYQFSFWRCGYSIEDGSGSHYTTPWYPMKKAEDTYCYCNLDSMTMRVGSYEYQFMARCFDDEYNPDTTPDTVRFVGNFPPVIDEVWIGYDAEPTVPGVQFASIAGDTFYIGLGKVFQSRPDTVSPYQIEFDAQNLEYTFFYKVILRGTGHDDNRESPGSGIKGWRYRMRGSEDHYLPGDGEWIYDGPINELYREIPFRIVIPYDTEAGGPDYSIIDDPPGFLGEQELTVDAVDIGENDTFIEEIRAISPVFLVDDPCTKVSPGGWTQVQRDPSRHARFDTHAGHFYIKLVL